MNKQHRQYVILIVVLLSCAASVFFGVKSILHSNDEVTTFAVGDWEGITLPRYHGPAVYSTPAQQGSMVTLPMTSTSSRSLFHHNVAATYRAGVTTTQQTQTGYSAAYKVHQTSDQEAHSIGSGNGSSCGASVGTTNYSSSSGASYSMLSVTLTPSSVRTRTLANNNIIGANTASTPSFLADAGTVRYARASGIRRAMPDTDGSYDGQLNDDGDYIWDAQTETWIPKPSNGATHPHNQDYVWVDGQGWRPKSELHDPNAPIGDIPWWMFLFATMLYGGYRSRRWSRLYSMC